MKQLLVITPIRYRVDGPGEMDRYPVVQGARRLSNRNPRLPDMDKGPGSRAAHDAASLRLRSRDGPLELPFTSI